MHPTKSSSPFPICPRRHQASPLGQAWTSTQQNDQALAEYVWVRHQASPLGQAWTLPNNMNKPLPILLGKVPTKPIRASLDTHPTE